MLGTTLNPAGVRAVFELGKSQKADGLTKVLTGALMKTFVSDSLTNIAVVFSQATMLVKKLVCVGRYPRLISSVSSKPVDLLMGNLSSQPEPEPSIPTAAQRNSVPVSLCSTTPNDVVHAEHYVEELWAALDKTLDHSGCGVGSDAPEGQGGTVYEQSRSYLAFFRASPPTPPCIRVKQVRFGKLAFLQQNGPCFGPKKM